ncbi:hypothetical protein [Lewinella sp. IMCC34191]|uniref:hypothetical protein n=1 Tax=Lewinella sp. IMCC34191 TaxID=2259172 RepID=UPI000E2583CE|nr:hypothetical protein [Lewinella sp. IMCC34191]
MLIICQLSAQGTVGPGGASTYVDGQGVIRWSGSDEEITGFGVNYTVPFAHAYRSAERLGLEPKRMIDRDVYHFSRLGFDLYRVHVWDTEISDTLGNLLDNEHLDAFDYLIAELGKRGINYVLTPIAYWGNGWPEPDRPTPGFSHKFGKAGSLTTPEAIRAQERYLRQFMEHVNPYTGVAYADDPRLLAVEISNEPHHDGTPETVTDFVRRMREAVEASGTEKPVFYNISHSTHLMEAYFAADIRGGTFQWYPTGLGYGKALPGNVLPNVDRYTIPFDSIIRAAGGAKIVYEFDPADVNSAYPYPAMARSFRSAGIQLATHFSYDPTYLAAYNTEYNTHYMNLLYAPQKAIGLMIAAEVFRQVPRYADYGSYPADTTFDAFSVSYERDLALLNDGTHYYYSNDVKDSPRMPDSLSSIAGFGSSPLVRYGGTGAYFLDQLEEGVWRLEVLPDALQIRDAYGRNSLDKVVTVLQENIHDMTLSLPSLDGSFMVRPINAGNDWAPGVREHRFAIRPGVYLLGDSGRVATREMDAPWAGGRLRDYAGTEGTVDRVHVVHSPPPVVQAIPYTVAADIVSPDSITRVELVAPLGPPIEMKRTSGFTYSATVPIDRVKPGAFTYYIKVTTRDSERTFPPDVDGDPYEWDFYQRTPYETRVVPVMHDIRLFDAHRDRDALVLSQWTDGLSLRPSGPGLEDEFLIRLSSLARAGNGGGTDSEASDYAIRHYLKPVLGGLRGRWMYHDSLVIRGESLYGQPQPIEVGLTLSDGSTFATVVDIPVNVGEVVVALADLELAPTVLLPRPYPGFLPYLFESQRDKAFDLSEVESLQIRIGPGQSNDQLAQPQGLGLISVDIR